AVGLDTSFVGHPVLESGAREADPVRFRAAHGIALDEPLLCVLPGSRRGEVRRHLPPFGDAVARLKEQIPRLRVVVPTLPAVSGEVAARTADWPVPVIMIDDDAEKYGAMASSN